MAWLFGFWKQEVIEVCLFHRPIWEAGSFAGVWESQIDIYLYYSSAAMFEAAHRLHHTKAGLPDILGLLYFGQDGDGLVCFGFFFYFVSFTRFQFCFATCFVSNAKSIAGQVDF